MQITEVAKLVGSTTDDIRYFERKGYVSCRWVILKKRQVRDYSDAEVRKIELLVKFRRQGFQHSAAYTRAVEELEQPLLI